MLVQMNDSVISEEIPILRVPSYGIIHLSKYATMTEVDRYTYLDDDDPVWFPRDA